MSSTDAITNIAATNANNPEAAGTRIEICRTRIKQSQPALNALISIDAPTSERAANGALAGVPIVHKDLFCTRGQTTTAGSKMLANFTAPYDATVVSRLEAAGAVTLGKANMDEFAMGSSNETSYFGAVANPWDQSRVPGGSSGGSAAAVAAGLAPAATGTDTGGSIRQPAALCGVTGIKPTYGRVSRFGMIAFASSLDQAGCFARSAADCAPLLQTMAGTDANDSTVADEPVADYAGSLNGDIAGLTIGLPRQYFAAGVETETATALNAAIRELEALGAHVVDVDMPYTDLALSTYYIIAPAEASSNLARYDGVRYGHRCADPADLTDLYERSRAEGFGPEVQRRILTGTYVLSAGYYDAYYRKAQRTRRLIADDFSRAFESVDLLATPATPGPAFELGSQIDDPTTMYANDVFTLPASLAGVPAMSVPAGFSGHLPVGLQMIAPWFAEARLLNAGHAYQQATDWHTRQPPGFEWSQ
ncbi:Asp-tRNA(Asn)/Glu-tRNA(Gln) amidotransferase subunit GatA [Salinisphaera sp. USBA-960]|nr:Asp-tRNA(Asn)/Glu-tRNA(Gln) amidotransferase subunit GatA [Salifodinibacter halophilus]NNC26940.1 Asp-tRNA(Asn)/Glu-tRNA(Gln) amidotransferase subunit GatA [Salifodinibacter halophilus]